MDAQDATGGGFSHEAVFYRQSAQYQSAVLGFVRDGLTRSEPALVVVPAAAAGLLRSGLDGAPGVEFADMARLGRNPGRLIGAIWDFADRYPGRPVRFVGEPLWPGRSDAEIRETATHEAMLNMAFAAQPVAMLCPYDADHLAPDVLASAARTHPVTRMPDGARDSSGYRAGTMPDGPAFALSAPPDGAARLAYRNDLRAVRGSVARYADQAGLAADRQADLVIAVGEVIANTLRHTADGGIIFVWHTASEVVCQVSDKGWIADPLVGRRRPIGPGGLGLWVVNQVCDLVEMRTGEEGTTIRMHMALPPLSESEAGAEAGNDAAAQDGSRRHPPGPVRRTSVSTEPVTTPDLAATAESGREPGAEPGQDPASTQLTGETAQIAGDPARVTGDGAWLAGETARVTGDDAWTSGDAARLTGAVARDGADGTRANGDGARASGDGARVSGDGARASGGGAGVSGEGSRVRGDAAGEAAGR
jgi:anti-sigma regulatory factor (Ser/Thr protein kinase)